MKNDRLFGIMHLLIERGSVTAKELSERFEVSVRTIYRDIEVLSMNGIPVYTTQGKGGGISLMEGYSVDKAMLTDEEQKQVLMALESLQALTGKKGDASLEKLRNIFHKNTRSWISIDFSSWEDSPSEKEIFSGIQKGILEQRLLRIVYHSNKQELTERIIKPEQLVYKGTSWYLYGYCMLRRDFRYFKVRRIEKMEVLSREETMNIPDIEEAIASKESDFGDNQQASVMEHRHSKKEPVTLRIEGRMAFRVLDEFRDARIEKQGEDFIIHTQLPDEEWVYCYLLGYADSLDIIEPVSFRQKMQRIVEKVNQKYFKT